MEERFNKKLYMGIVEDNYDPNRKGRLKVRVQSLYNEIPVESIPYASPFMDLAGKEFKVPSVGKIVNVLFLTNDFYDPYYIYSENYNINLENKLSDLSADEYVNFVALLFDERTQISADSEELTIDHFYNKMTINKESINHELKDNNQLLNLGDRAADQDAVLGNHWFEWFDRFVDELLLPTSLLGNMMAPVQKVKLDILLQEYKVIKDTFRSNHVKIVDNNQVTTLERTPATDTTKEDKNLIDNTIKFDDADDMQNIVDQQNEESCKNEKSGKPSTQLPQPETETNENNTNFIPEGGSYEKRLIDGKIYTVTDQNRTFIDNLEKSIEANKKLDNSSSNGKYKGQNYYIEGQQNQKSKVYDPQEIENSKITMPDSVGNYPIYLTGASGSTKSGVMYKNKLVIADYYPPFKKMVDAAKIDGVTIILNDAFRKYEDQMKLRVKNAPYNKKNNKEFLETSSSTNFNPYTGRPGWSRHHYGIAFDISTAGGKNKAYKWLEKNALAFGFIRTVKSETWHWEYEPWTILNISQDKYARVPKGHSTWNISDDDDTGTTSRPNTSKKNTPSDNSEC